MILRAIAAVLLSAMGVVCAGVGVQVLTRLTWSYRDSPAATYVILGGFLVAAGVASIAFALRTLLHRSPGNDDSHDGDA